MDDEYELVKLIEDFEKTSFDEKFTISTYELYDVFNASITRKINDWFHDYKQF